MDRTNWSMLSYRGALPAPAPAFRLLAALLLPPAQSEQRGGSGQYTLWRSIRHSLTDFIPVFFLRKKTKLFPLSMHCAEMPFTMQHIIAASNVPLTLLSPSVPLLLALIYYIFGIQNKLLTFPLTRHYSLYLKRTYSFGRS